MLLVLANEKSSLLVNIQSNNILLTHCYPTSANQINIGFFQLVDNYVNYDERVDTTNAIK